MIAMRPLIDAVTLAGLGGDAVEEQQALLLLLLHHLAIRKAAATRDVIELRFAVELRSGAACER